MQEKSRSLSLKFVHSVIKQCDLTTDDQLSKGLLDDDSGDRFCWKFHVDEVVAHAQAYIPGGSGSVLDHNNDGTVRIFEGDLLDFVCVDCRCDSECARLDVTAEVVI